MKVSVILPTLNEFKRNDLVRLLPSLQACKGLELIAVDGGSTDGTIEFLKKNSFQVFADSSNRRADRLSLGFKKSTGDILVFHHPRSILDSEGLRYLQNLPTQSMWGGFRHGFDREHWMLRFTSWYSNQIRPRLSQVIYLDHCLFATRDLLEKVPEPCFPAVDIFEDTLFCYRLRKFSRPQILNFKSKTSAVRFEQNGFWRQALLNQVMKLCFHLGVSALQMNRIYEKGLSLNSNYSGKPKTNK